MKKILALVPLAALTIAVSCSDSSQSPTAVRPLFDNVNNNSNDVVMGDHLDDFVAGGSTTISYKVVGTGGDGQSGCNASDGSDAIVTVNVPAAVTATPASLTFTTCNTPQAVTFSSSTPGSYTITVSVSDTGAGTYSAGAATFTLTVIPATNLVVSNATGMVGGTASLSATLTAASNGTPISGKTISFMVNGNSVGTAPTGVNGVATVNASLTGFAVGTYPIEATFAGVAGTWGGSTGTAQLTVTSPAPANTSPSVSVAGVTNGASYNTGSVPVATCQVTDAEDGPSSFNAALSAITGPYASDGIGSQTATCTHTDNGGLAATPASATYSIVDPTPPSISYIRSPTSPDGNNGWYKSSVTLAWTVSDPESPNSLAMAGAKTGCVDQNITADQAEQTYTCSATSAGGSATEVSVSIKRDGTAPTVAFTSASPAANAYGWRNTDVVATFTATDNLSGFGSPVSATKTGNATTSDEGLAVTVGSPAFTDNAGNTVAAEAASSPAFKIDKTAPTDITFVGSIGEGASYYFNFVPAAPTCTAIDALSGLFACNVTGHGTSVGSHTLTAIATDKADNFDTATRSYTVLAWNLSGFYEPVTMNALNTAKSGSTVPLKFEIFAGPVGQNEQTSTSAVKSFVVQQITCDLADDVGPEDAIELYSTGGTSLRYDATAGQFIQNWQTPKNSAGKCYRVTMTALDGISKITANFKLK
jgi:hypothetical protein